MSGDLLKRDSSEHEITNDPLVPLSSLWTWEESFNQEVLRLIPICTRHGVGFSFVIYTTMLGAGVDLHRLVLRGVESSWIYVLVWGSTYLCLRPALITELVVLTSGLLPSRWVGPFLKRHLLWNIRASRVKWHVSASITLWKLACIVVLHLVPASLHFRLCFNSNPG